VKQVKVTLASPVREYEIKIGRGLLHKVGDEARRSLRGKGRRAVIISNARVFDLSGRTVEDSLLGKGFSVSHWLMGEGERFKSLRTLEKALAVLSQAGLERHDVVVALGGGVVGDLAGFAAAVYLRGVPFIQVPTTLLAQIDSSVGGKTGINLATGKNLVGAFHQPSAVVIDTETLATLPARELSAGWCEAVKMGAVGSRRLFEDTTEFLESSTAGQKKDSRLRFRQLEAVIEAQCAFKASIVAGDEHENVDRKDHRSRRILNFGHTVGHALEAVTRYHRFRHGEAVGHGMLVAGEISKNLGLLAPSELESLREAIRLCGPLPPAGDIDEQEIMEVTHRDKKSMGGQVQWILLERIGRARIVDGLRIDPQLLRASLRAALKHEQ
jgi:3-dehydroquinate synthase